jgi:hypothetical protein
MNEWSAGTWACAIWTVGELVGLWIVICLLPALRWLGLPAKSPGREE